MDKSMIYPGTTGRSDPSLGEETYRKLIQLVCFLRQLNPFHDTENLDDIDDDLGSRPPLDGSPGTGTSPESKVELRQILVDAIAFVASSERTAAHVVAVAVEEMEGPVVRLSDGRGSTGGLSRDYGRMRHLIGLRFRLSMNGEIPQSMLDELNGLGAILGQLNAGNYDDIGAHQKVFDSIIQMKRRNLATLLKGGLGPLSLLKLFEDARNKLTASGDVRYPLYSNTLAVSAEELERNGVYTADTHDRHMKAAWSHFEKLEKLCRKSVNRGKEKSSQGGLKVDAMKALILLAFEGRHSKCFHYLLTRGDNTASTKLYQVLRKLSRYWKCAIDLVKCARSESFARLFQNVEFCAIPRMPAKPVTLLAQNGTGLLPFLVSLGYYDSEVLWRYGSRYSGADTEFSELQKKELYVHAEIGLIYFYAMYPEFRPSPEIGCSKHACFLCDIFIKHHPDFKIRATHKKVYVGWALPDLEGIMVGDRSSSEKLKIVVSKTIGDIEKAAKTEFDSPRTRQPDNMLPDSSSGVSETETVESGTVMGAGSDAGSVDTVNPLDPYSNRAVKEKVMKQKRFSEMARYLTGDIGGLESPFGGMQLDDHNPKVGKCYRCGRDTTDRCIKCGRFLCYGGFDE